jgi:tRNA threonylcarbamoyladenosine biosynthesis protein TsaB
MLLVLALDTTTRPGSLALVRDDQVLAVASGDPGRTHAERLPGDITSLLSGARVDLKQIDVFAVAAGPGSFTGLRIGIATIQGLAFALDRPVVAVSTLDALARIAAESTSQSPALVAAWMDAQRSEVFAALYQVCARPGGSQSLDAGAAFDLIDGPVSEAPGEVLVRWHQMAAGRTIHVAGDGVGRYRDLLARHLGSLYQPVEPLPALAPVIGRLGVREALSGHAVAPHAVRPIYVRRPDAELARDRRQVPPATTGRDGA